MHKIKVAATIPTAQYENVSLETEVEADTYEQAKDIAEHRLWDWFNAYSKHPLNRKAGDFVVLDTFTGEKIKYNEDTHSYTTIDNLPLVSGSAYAKQFEEPFPKDMILPKLEKKYGVSSEIIDEMWTANANNSMAFGTVIHAAMEQFFKHRDHGCAEKEYHLPKHPFLRNLVTSFPLSDKIVMPEVLVSNVENRMVGRIDGIVVDDMDVKVCKLIDYKSNADITKDLPKYFKQLEFYAQILILAGWKVEALGIWNFTDEWKCYKETEWDFLPLTPQQ